MLHLSRDVEWDRPQAYQEVVPTDYRIPWEAAVSALVHTSGRQPAHRLKVLGMRHRNIVQGGHRNQFVEDSTVVLVTRYHKGYEVAGDVKMIHRSSSNTVSESNIQPSVSKDGNA